MTDTPVIMGHLSDGVATCNEVILSLLSKTRQRERGRGGEQERKKESKKEREREREQFVVFPMPNAVLLLKIRIYSNGKENKGKNILWTKVPILLLQ